MLSCDDLERSSRNLPRERAAWAAAMHRTRVARAAAPGGMSRRRGAGRTLDAWLARLAAPR